MRVSEYVAHDATGLAALIRSGAVSAAEVQLAAREAIELVDAEVNALVAPILDGPLDHARDGFFAGVPFLLKDAGAPAAGLGYEIGSRLLSGFVAREDSETVTRFKRAGLAIMGRTATPEFTMDWNTTSVVNGPTRNPWDPDRVAGGSSGGAAALVAAGAVPMAHGNDSAGSIRIPASCCGVVGLKPSRNRMPMEQSVVGDELNVDFAVTRTLRDAATLLDLLHGPAAWSSCEIAPPSGSYVDELGREPERMRIGVLDGGGMRDVSDACTTVVQNVARALERAGHDVVCDAPRVQADAAGKVDMTEVSTYVAAWIDVVAARHGTTPSPDNLESVIWKTYELGKATTAVELRRTWSERLASIAAVRGFFERCDILISPVVAGPAPMIEESGTLDDDVEHPADWFAATAWYMPFTGVFNRSGNPAISLPLGMSDDGLPVGVQLVAPFGEEARLLRLAGHLEACFPWSARVPRVWAGAT